MNMRDKKPVMKSLEEILAETSTEASDDNSEATRMVSDRSNFESGDDQSSPLDDAFDAHTVIRPMSAFQPPPPPKPAETPKAAAPPEEKPQPRPMPPTQPQQPASRRAEPSFPIDIPRPVDHSPKNFEVKAEPKPQVRVETPAPVKSDEDFKVQMIHPKKPVVQEPSPITALIERPPQEVAKNPFDEITANHQMHEDFSLDNLTRESSDTLSDVTSSGSEVTGVSLFEKKRGVRQIVSRVPLQLFLPILVFVAIIGAWAMLRHAPVADTSTQFDAETRSEPARPARQAQSPVAPRVAERNVAEQPSQVESQGVQPTVTPPPLQSVMQPEVFMSSFDRAFTKTQDQAKYSTNRL